MIELLQNVTGLFFSSQLYVTTAWYATGGFYVYSSMLAYRTEVKFRDFIKSFAQIYGLCCAISFVAAPIFSVVVSGFTHVLDRQVAYELSRANVYVWFSVSMMWTLRYLICKTFLSLSCRMWNVWLLIATVIASVWGYFVLTALNLL